MVKSGLNPQLNVKKNPNADCYLTKRVFMKLPKQSLPVNRREILEPNLVLVKFRDSKGKLQQKYNLLKTILREERLNLKQKQQSCSDLTTKTKTKEREVEYFKVQLQIEQNENMDFSWKTLLL